MADLGHILIADDEETFLYSTADLLRREGFRCDCASDGRMALETIRKAEYDLLIADIKMEGNIELELVRELPKIKYMPVILVTGYPSMKSAIQAVQLPVIAYLIKPFNFEELLTQVKDGIKRVRLVKTVKNIQKRLKQWSEELKGIEKTLDLKFQPGSSMSVDTFITLTLHNICSSLMDLRYLTQTAAVGDNAEEICRLFHCPRLSNIKEALSETVEVIESTKSSFRSKDLGELRERLEGLLKQA